MTRFQRHARPWPRLALVGLLALVSARGAAEDLEAATAAKLGDYPAAIARWQGFAQQGDPDSAFRLGQAYEAGRGVPRDPGRAQYWYRLAAANGSGPAAMALGAMAESAERPDGTPQDLATAVAWYRKALDAGQPAARQRLAALGAIDGAPAPAPAAAPSPPIPHVAPPAPQRPEPAADPAAGFERAVAFWRAHGIEATGASTLAALEAAAKRGNPLAEYDLAYAYEHGLGVPAAPARAYAWYRRAEQSAGPARLRAAAEANRRNLDGRLSDREKQAAEPIGETVPVR